MEAIVGLMSPETEKELGRKAKFKNKVAEAVDDPFIRIVDNRVFAPLAKKLPEDVRLVVIAALAEVIAEMPEFEI